VTHAQGSFSGHEGAPGGLRTIRNRTVRRNGAIPVGTSEIADGKSFVAARGLHVATKGKAV
jgi:hypothetical protein